LVVPGAAVSVHRGIRFRLIMALIVGLSVVVVSFSYRLNKDCLMVGLDGASWLTYLGYQHNDRLPYAQIGADPLQGNFDAYFPVALEYLLPEALMQPFADVTAAKAFNYSIYYLLMLAAFYVFVRSIAIPWPAGLLAANLFAVLGFPGLMHLNTQTYGPQSKTHRLAGRSRSVGGTDRLSSHRCRQLGGASYFHSPGDGHIRCRLVAGGRKLAGRYPPNCGGGRNGAGRLGARHIRVFPWTHRIFGVQFLFQ
jgi:hypothetical protein